MARPKIRRTVVRNGAWKVVKATSFEGCCDCGLIHRVEFRSKRGKLQYRVFRDEELTAIARKQFRHPCRRINCG